MASSTAYQLKVAALTWLTEDTFELEFHRPAGFSFTPGQKIRFMDGTLIRDYTLINAPDAPLLAVCVRHIQGGVFSPKLAKARAGDTFTASGAFGYFAYHASSRPAVFVATGTGIAPFAAFARAGVTGFTLLHGVRSQGELYYRDELAAAAASYRACLSGRADTGGSRFFRGRVTDYLDTRLPTGVYDFYLCGRGDMIAQATLTIDRRFSGSFVFSESFF